MFKFIESIEEKNFLLLLYAISLASLIAFSAALGFDTSRRSDSWGYLFEAELMAEGRLWMPAPEVPDAFHMANVVVDDGRMYGRYFPGQPLLIAASLLLFHHPYPVLWIVCALVPLLFYLILKQLFPVVSLGILRLLPFLFLLNLDFLTHSSTLLPYGTTVAFEMLGLYLLIIQPHARKKMLVIAAAAASLGFATLIRPLDGLLAIFIFGSVWTYISYKRQGIGQTARQTATAAAVLLVFAAMMLAYNHQLTGNALISPYQKYLPGDAPFKFGCVQFNPSYKVCVDSGLFIGQLLNNILGLFDFLGYRPNLNIHFLPEALSGNGPIGVSARIVAENLLNITGIMLSMAALAFMLKKRSTLPKESHHVISAIGLKIFAIVAIYSSLADQWAFGYMYLARPYLQLLVFGGLAMFATQHKKEIPSIIAAVIFAANGAYGNIKGNIDIINFDNRSKSVIEYVKKLNPEYKKVLFVDNLPKNEQDKNWILKYRELLLLYPINWDINWYVSPKMDDDPLVVRFTNQNDACTIMRRYPTRLPFILHLVKEPSPNGGYKPMIEPLRLECK